MKKSFYSLAAEIAVPVTLQSLLQSSFSVVDQIMTGQLGSVNIAGIGLAGKFSSIFSVLVSAIGTAAGIMIAQFMGKQDEEKVSRSFWGNLVLALLLAGVFSAACIFFPAHIMGIYTEDVAVCMAAAGYLRILAFSYLPLAAGTLISTMLRCMDGAALPLYAGIVSACINTALNYVLIFGRFGFPAMGVRGAAVATVMAQAAGLLMQLFLFCRHYRKQGIRLPFCPLMGREGGIQYLGILAPILTCELLWSLGENVYGIIYGHIGTDACAAMTLTAPVQILFIGALNGLAQAAGILIGKSLGSGAYEEAYGNSKKLMTAGMAGAVLLSVLLILCRQSYVRIYSVSDEVRKITCQILLAYALVAPVKVENMILGGGIIRSGGKTKYVMWIDIIGTWCFGVPLGLLAAFVFCLPIPYVYFILSMEECVRLLLSLAVFRRRGWMERL